MLNSKARFLLAVSLSILTIIGGHFINRRYDRALLFISLNLFASTFYFFGYRTLFYFFEQAGIQIENVPLVYHVFFGLLVFFWLASIVTTARDALKPDSKFQSAWSTGGVIGAILISIFIAGATMWQSYRNIVYMLADEGEREQKISSFFFEMVTFGGHDFSAELVEGTPEGNGILSGMIGYKNEPASGVHLQLILNNKFRTKELITNDKGEFSLNLPEGTWFLNEITVTGWENKPDHGNFMLLTGYEPVLKNKNYSQFPKHSDSGLPLVISSDSKDPALKFRIEPKFNLSWPDKEKIKTDASTDKITWDVYPGASTYLVKIYKITRDEKGEWRSSHQHLSKIMKNTNELVLSALMTANASGAEHEYGVEILAFDENNYLMSESSARTAEKTFILKDGLQLVDDDALDILSRDSSYTIDAIYNNRNTIARIESLITDKKYEEAEKLLTTLQGPTEPGQPEALTGYLYAEQGKCEEANRMFEKALEIGGNSCVIPSFYREKCKKSDDKNSIASLGSE